MSPSYPLWLRTAAAVGGLLRLASAPFRRRPAVLLVKPGSLGDALLFSGALRRIREQFADRRIVLVTSDMAAALLAGDVSRSTPAFAGPAAGKQGREESLAKTAKNAEKNSSRKARKAHGDAKHPSPWEMGESTSAMPELEVVALPVRSLGSASLRSRLARVTAGIRIFRRNYELVLNPTYRTGVLSHQICALAHAPRKVWFRGEAAFGESALAEPETIYTELVEVERDAHELDKTVALLRAAGCEGVRGREDIWPDLELSEADREKARRIVEGMSLTRLRWEAPAWHAERTRLRPCLPLTAARQAENITQPAAATKHGAWTCEPRR